MPKILKIWHISDTHGFHGQLIVPEGVDIVIHSGDASNYRNEYRNQPEMLDFLNWYTELDIPYKVYVAGNHDSSVEKGLIKKAYFKKLGIDYLFQETLDVEGIKIWGSPFTPEFNGWSFMKNRAKISRVWDSMPDNTDILVTHGPPKAILDFAVDYDRKVEMCGDSSLGKRLVRSKVLLHCFGHIHNNGIIKNSGTLQLANEELIYSNASCVTDNKFGRMLSNGNILYFNLETRKVTTL